MDFGKLDLICRYEVFKMLPDQTIDLSDTPDLGPVLFAVAAAKGGGVFTGIRRLRIKESDRAQAMADELAKFGAVCKVTENEMIIQSSGLKKPDVPLNGHNDHRVVMALSILASITGGTIAEEPEPISIEGISSDHTDAATITPDAKPSKIFCSIGCISFFMKKTKAEPRAVPRKGIRSATNTGFISRCNYGRR